MELKILTHAMVTPLRLDVPLRYFFFQTRLLHLYNTTFAKTRLITMTRIDNYNKIIACTLYSRH